MMFGRYHKRYTKPRKAYDKIRIDEENELVERYGLRNKREIWKADAAITTLRNRAKSLIGKEEELQKNFIEKLKNFGFDVEKIADVLALDKEDYLKRRLQSIIIERKLAHTSKQARQLIVHKHIMVDGRVINIPSYLVRVDEESKIGFRRAKKDGN